MVLIFLMCSPLNHINSLAENEQNLPHGFRDRPLATAWQPQSETLEGWIMLLLRDITPFFSVTSRHFIVMFWRQIWVSQPPEHPWKSMTDRIFHVEFDGNGFKERIPLQMGCNILRKSYNDLIWFVWKLLLNYQFVWFRVRLQPHWQWASGRQFIFNKKHVTCNYPLQLFLNEIVLIMISHFSF